MQLDLPEALEGFSLEDARMELEKVGFFWGKRTWITRLLLSQSGDWRQVAVKLEKELGVSPRYLKNCALFDIRNATDRTSVQIIIGGGKRQKEVIDTTAATDSLTHAKALVSLYME